MTRGPQHAVGNGPLRFHIDDDRRVKACRRVLPCDCRCELGTVATLEQAVELSGQPTLTVRWAPGFGPAEEKRGRGRPPALTPDQLVQLKKLSQDGWKSEALATFYGVTPNTIYRLLRTAS